MSTVLVDKKNKIATLTIDRPKALNALNQEVVLDLREALFKVEDVSVVILTGSGEKAFVAGADIVSMIEMGPLEARTFAELGQGLIQALQETPYITIAAVNGFALGGGLELALACDLIYASDNAKMGLPETNLGIIPGFGGTVNLLERVGFHRAMEMILTGKMISAEEAKSIGLVLETYSHTDLLNEVEKTAQGLADKGLLSLLAARRLVRASSVREKDKSLLLERESFATLFAGSEQKEGMKAFIEKRKPNFK